MMEDAISPSPRSTLALLVQAVRRSYQVVKLIKEDVPCQRRTPCLPISSVC